MVCAESDYVSSRDELRLDRRAAVAPQDAGFAADLDWPVLLGIARATRCCFFCAVDLHAVDYRLTGFGVAVPHGEPFSLAGVVELIVAAAGVSTCRHRA